VQGFLPSDHFLSLHQVCSASHQSFCFPCPVADPDIPRWSWYFSHYNVVSGTSVWGGQL